MAISTYNELVQRMIAEILASRPDANLTTGTLARDILIDIPAYEMARLYTAIEDVQRAQSILLAEGDVLTSLLENYSLARKSALRSTGSIWFQRTTVPSADIIVPVGTRVNTASTVVLGAVEFVTNETVVMLVSQAIDYWNESEGVYEIEASLEAISPGADGNVGAGTILFHVGVSGFTRVHNTKPTTGGRDAESDEDFRRRGLHVLSGNSIGSKDGYQQLIDAQNDVLDSYVVTPGMDEGIRIRDGGGADIYVRAPSTVESTIAYTYPADEEYKSIPSKPLVSVNAILEDGVYLVEGLDYRVDIDTEVYARSIYSLDKVTWLTDRVVGAAMQIGYSYSAVIQTLQDLVDQYDKHVVGVDVLLKLGYEAIVDVTMVVELLPGYATSVVEEDVVNTVTGYINDLGMGDDVQQSDVVAKAEAVSGVDSLVLPFTTFRVTREVSGVTDGTDEIEGEEQALDTSNLRIRRSEYPRSGTISVSSY